VAIREGKWKCKNCDNVALGHIVVCPTCGQARGDDVEFFIEDDDAPEVTDGALLAQANAGSDWICAYCKNSNKATQDKACASCGAPREEGATRAAGEVVGLGYKSASEQRKAEAAAVPASVAPAAAAPAGSGIFTKLIFGCLALLILSCCLGTWILGRKREAQLTVSTISWKRTVEVEKWATVTHDDWNVPSGGRVLGSSREVRDYEQVQVGTREVTKTRRVQSGTERVRVGKKNKGNGFFEDVYEDRPVYRTQTYTEREPVYERRPIYATKYRYEIDEWVKDRDEVAQGQDLKPAWPTFQLAAATKEREGRRSEVYEVTLRDERESFVYTATGEADFIRFAPGSRWTGLVRSGKAEQLKPFELAAEAGR
jgi:hypothetical protein